MSNIEKVVGWLRGAMQLHLAVVTFGWLADLPARNGYYFYPEQFLALAAGYSVVLILLSRTPAWPPLAWPPLALLNLLFAAVCYALFTYVAINYPMLQLDLALAPPSAVALGLVMIVGVLEATRRQTGLFLPVLIVVMAGLVFLTPHLPDSYSTRPVSMSRLAVYLALDTNALFSKILYIAAVVVAPFILFGALLNGLGGSALFSHLAARLVGRFRGGAAKISVVGSAAFGMVSGSAVANVAAVGAVSIPMMRRAGYRAPTAAAIEAISSTGGQLMPPIMGASAFLMSELLEIAYVDIAKAAILPALLFYFALFLAVDLEARKFAPAGGEAVDEAPSQGRQATVETQISAWDFRFMIPVGVLIYYLFVERRTPEFSGLAALLSLFLVSFIAPGARPMKTALMLGRQLLAAMRGLADIIVLAAAAGFVIGVLNVSGLSFVLTLQILAASGGMIFVMLLLTALLSILLGMGMPTVGVYILLATLIAPSLVELGVTPLAAHMFVLYFGILSMITPPVAIASFAAANIANTSPWQTAFSSLRIGIGIYVIPFVFVLYPEMLTFQGDANLWMVVPSIMVVIILLTGSSIGALAVPISMSARVVLLALGMLLLFNLFAGNNGFVSVAFIALAVILLAFLIVTGRQVDRIGGDD
jgi:TRAP transporter 4TM/12TM fusion protein